MPEGALTPELLPLTRIATLRAGHC